MILQAIWPNQQYRSTEGPWLLVNQANLTRLTLILPFYRVDWVNVGTIVSTYSLCPRISHKYTIRQDTID